MRLTTAVLFALSLASYVHTTEAAPDASQKLAVASIFSDHMVLQRDARAPVWGTAAPLAKVTVTVDGSTSETTADVDGTWKLDLDAHAAGDRVVMEVKSGDQSVTLDDIVFGDVWIASGQSNMWWKVIDADGAADAIAASANPLIRAIEVPQRPTDKPESSFRTQGWRVAGPDQTGAWPAVGYYFARDLQKQLAVPIGIISCNHGGSPMEAWTSREALAAVPTFADDYDKAHELLENKAVDDKGNPLMHPHHVPAALFNGMVSPIVPYGIQGVIWYQGEENTPRPGEYLELSKTMIADWRRRFGQGDFPFLLVQLAAWGPGIENWPYLREAQAETLTVPHTGMAVAIDIGDREDIHPRNKAEVGRRLALVARHVAYGDDQVEYSGPTYRTLKVEGSKLRLSFDHAKGMRSSERELKGFEIAGADGQFVPARAAIDGTSVVLTAGGVKEPKIARYGWAAYPEATLENDANLPAVPFRSS